jgi:hypothetical protein
VNNCVARTPFLMESKFIPKAIQIVKSAVQADYDDNLKEALTLYKMALKYFLTGALDIFRFVFSVLFRLIGLCIAKV